MLQSIAFVVSLSGQVCGVALGKAGKGELSNCGVGQFSGQGAPWFEVELMRVSSHVLAVPVTQVLLRAC